MSNQDFRRGAHRFPVNVYVVCHTPVPNRHIWQVEAGPHCAALFWRPNFEWIRQQCDAAGSGRSIHHIL